VGLKNKKVVYTALIGDRNRLICEPVYITDGWDYICFTDLDTIRTEVPIEQSAWEFRRIKNTIDVKKMSRRIKILCDEYLPEYETSLYIDTRFRTVRDIDSWIKEITNGNTYDIIVMRHNKRSCLYKEADFLDKCNHSRYTKVLIRKQITDYKAEGVPRYMGLYAPGIMVRKHGNDRVKCLMSCWWEQIEKYSHRDQIGLAYSLWKNQGINMIAMDFVSNYREFVR